MDFLKTITGKVAAGIVALAVIVGGISWWQMDPSTRHTLASGTGRITAWFGIVLLLPWASFFVITRTSRFETNLAGALLVFAYTLVEVLLLLWLFNWSVPGAAAWTFVLLGALVAAVYNLFTCDWIAEKLA
ncbi:MAG: hypothetical protein NTU53_22510 [Planctomycetota bacterium]|nr:hypothetical protein [Planctomycetota bacterium]